MRGEVVVCKQFNGFHIVRVVWDVSVRLIFIHDEEQFSRRMKGEIYLDPVGFPADDVFIYDEALLAECQQKGEDPWSKLTPYNGTYASE